MRPSRAPSERVGDPPRSFLKEVRLVESIFKLPGRTASNQFLGSAGISATYFRALAGIDAKSGEFAYNMHMLKHLRGLALPHSDPNSTMPVSRAVYIPVNRMRTPDGDFITQVRYWDSPDRCRA